MEKLPIVTQKIPLKTDHTGKIEYFGILIKVTLKAILLVFAILCERIFF